MSDVGGHAEQGGRRHERSHVRSQVATEDSPCRPHRRPRGRGTVRAARAARQRGRPVTRRWSTRSPARTPSPATPRASGTSPAPAAAPSRASRPTSASTRARRSASRSTPPRRRTGSTSTGWATTAATAPARSRRSLPTALNNQPNCLTDAATGLVDCGNWTQTASWAVPADAVSGHLLRQAGPHRRHRRREPHLLRRPRRRRRRRTCSSRPPTPPGRPTTATAATASTPAHPAGRAYKVSYNRPFTTRGNAPEDWVFNAEYPMVRFLEANGYDVSYTTGVDTDRRGAELLEHKVFLSVGHDEYWSGHQRANVEAARDAGVNLAFFSGNEVFWKTRWENSIDGSGTPAPHAGDLQGDPRQREDRPARPRRGPAPGATRGSARPADGGRPENAPDRHDLHGQLLRHQHGGRCRPTARCASGATPGSPTLARGRDDDHRHQRHRLRVGRGPRQRLPPAGLVPRVRDQPAAGDRLQDYGSSYAPGRPRTP